MLAASQEEVIGYPGRKGKQIGVDERMGGNGRQSECINSSHGDSVHSRGQLPIH